MQTKLMQQWQTPKQDNFTAKTPSTLEAYVAQSEDKTTLTFYYDAQRNAHTGKTWDIEDVFTDEFGNQFPAWAGNLYEREYHSKKGDIRCFVQ